MIRFQLDAPAATKPCRSGVSDRAARDRNAIYFSDLGCLGAQCLTAAIVQRRREPTCPSQTPEPPSDDPSGIQRATTLPVSGPAPPAPPSPPFRATCVSQWNARPVDNPMPTPAPHFHNRTRPPPRALLRCLRAHHWCFANC
jgi:hypothetical protein